MGLDQAAALEPVEGNFSGVEQIEHPLQKIDMLLHEAVSPLSLLQVT